jgi:conjugal transfer pilus assembly protein TraB
MDDLKRQWDELPVAWKVVFGVIVAVAIVVIVFRPGMPDRNAPAESASAQAPGAADSHDAAGSKLQTLRANNVLPTTDRNQGLENLATKLQSMDEAQNRITAALQDLQSRRANADSARRPDSMASMPNPLAYDTNVQGVDFSQPGTSPNKAGGSKPGAQVSDLNAPVFGQPGTGGASGGSTSNDAPIEQPTMKVWPAENASADSRDEQGALVIPVNSGFESVMLSGINARPSGSIAGAVGAATSANSVGAPFVTRIKGFAIMPNGQKVADLSDCFLGGSGIAILSTERAYVIAENLSCIRANGEVYEGPVKAYGLDVDGTLGIAGKVVSKQGSLLMQAALTGMASGLGAALSPTSITAYNSSAQNGSTSGVQYPALGTVAQTAVGQGINNAATQLSHFYLDYAKETFPVVEVVAGTRVTWVLKESVELKRRMKKMAIE